MFKSNFIQKHQKSYIYTGIFLISFSVFAFVSGKRIFRASSNNHFAYLALSWLKGGLEMPVRPPHGNDWAKVDVLTLKSGSVVKGTWWKSKGKYTFRTLDGDFLIIFPKEIKKRRAIWYVSFPPMPGVVMLPFVAKWGLRANDVLVTVIFAAFNPLLLFILLEILKKQKYHSRSVKDMLVLTFLFAFGTVYFFSAVRGEVWYTAHIMGITFLLLYLISLFKHKWFLAGLALSAAFLTRTPMLLTGILMPLLLWKESEGKIKKEDFVKLLVFGLPVAVFLIVVMYMNYIRFHNPFEFGHTYLNIRWRSRIERYGLFSYEYLSRNLSAALTLLPRFKTSFPYVQISPHGMALWLTTPVWWYLLWPEGENSLRKYIIFTIFPVFLLVLLYQNTGFVQFGYRFSLDFTVFLILLLALDARKRGKLFYSMVVLSIIINTFGAWTFGRYHAFYPPGSFFFFTM